MHQRLLFFLSQDLKTHALPHIIFVMRFFVLHYLYLYFFRWILLKPFDGFFASAQGKVPTRQNNNTTTKQ